MNKVYRLVWCVLRQVWICAAETARARGKASRSTVLLTVLGSSSLLAQAANPIGAPPSSTQLPTGGQVVAGQANISQAGSAMTVQQGSDRAAIDWQTFNLGSQASINFQQPSVNSVTLNRVLDANPSQIYGRLSANGHVFLSNPNGVYFAPSANVDVGGIVATTMGISNDDFMAGRDVFQRNGSTGAVLNLGRMQAAPGGVIALLAPEVRNEGVLIAQAGTVAMASGEAVTLHFGATSGLLDITVTPSQVRALVENRHAVLAEGGQIILSARAVDGLMASVIHSGELNASSIVEKGGRVFIEARDITLAAGSRIEATGATGGGTVLVGGQAKGAGDMYQATTVTMAEGASIDASATSKGDGGTVVLWSNIHDASAKTTAQGQIAARGGAQGGNGGFVETSGASLKVDGIRVDTSAAAGKGGVTGEWLLDPYDLIVDASAASTISTNLGTTDVKLLTTVSGASGPGVQNAGGSGDITVNSAISWASGNRLTLNAYRNVNINAAITASGAGKVTIITGDTAGTGVSGSATGDYSFGLGPSGFAGSLNFTGGSTSGATLNISTG
ncbi:MAG: filamentous hemagglutinin N-terminal domain-containing protein, partial [Comamonas sp.]